MLLLAIARHIDHEDDVSWQGVTTLAKLIRMSERNVQFLLRKLEAGSELVIEHGSGAGNTNRYQIVLEKKGENFSVKSMEKISKKGEKFSEKGEKFSEKGEKFSPDSIINRSRLYQDTHNAHTRARARTQGKQEAGQVKKVKRQSALETPPPDELPVSVKDREWAARYCPGLDLERETLKFLTKARAKGWTYKNWILARRSWLLNAVDYASERQSNAAINGTGRTSVADRNAQRLIKTLGETDSF